VTSRLLFHAAAVLASTLACSACLQPSLNPLVDRKDSRTDARLIGAWACNENEKWTFEAAEEKDDDGVHPFFRVTIKSDRGEARMGAILGRIGSIDFITFSLDDIPDIPLFAERHIIQAWTFGRIWMEADRIRLGMLDSDWFEKLDEATRSRLSAPQGEHSFVLTASVSALQSFAVAHAEEPAAFGDDITLVKAGQSGGHCYSER